MFLTALSGFAGMVPRDGERLLLTCAANRAAKCRHGAQAECLQGVPCGMALDALAVREIRLTYGYDQIPVSRQCLLFHRG